MFINRILAVSGALLSLVTAIPLNHKRDLVVLTKTHETVVTIAVTTTVWLGTGETAPTTVAGLYEQAATSSAIASPPTSSASPVAVSSYIPVPSPTTIAAQNAPSTTVAAAISTAAVQPTVAPVVQSTSDISSVAITSAALPPISTPAASPSPSPVPTSAASGTPNGLYTDDITEGPAAAGSSYVGDMTVYAPGMGACGVVSSSDDHIVAIGYSVFDYYVGGNPNDDPVCQQWVEITGVDGTVYPAKVVDRCPGCAGNDLDLSPELFNLVTKQTDTRVHNIHWQFAGSA